MAIFIFFYNFYEDAFNETLNDPGLRRFKTSLDARKPCWTGLPKEMVSPDALPSGMRYTQIRDLQVFFSIPGGHFSEISMML